MQTFNGIDYNTISHELRIPLTGILGMAGLLIDEEGLTKEQKEEVDLILQSSKRLRAFIEKLLSPNENYRSLIWNKSKEKMQEHERL